MLHWANEIADEVIAAALEDIGLRFSEHDPEDNEELGSPDLKGQLDPIVDVMDETGRFPVEIAKEHLGKKADRAIRILMRHGVHVVETGHARQHLAAFLRHKPRARILRVPRAGWFEVKTNSWIFVLPTETFVLDSATEGYGLPQSETSEDWRQPSRPALSLPFRLANGGPRLLRGRL